MRRISGRWQRGIRYALWTLGDATTTEILEYCYPWPGEDRNTFGFSLKRDYGRSD
jgi:hypothetical protein